MCETTTGVQECSIFQHPCQTGTHAKTVRFSVSFHSVRFTLKHPSLNISPVLNSVAVCGYSLCRVNIFVWGLLSISVEFSCFLDSKSILLLLSLSSLLCLRNDCYLAMRRWPSELCMPACPASMHIPGRRPPKSPNSYRKTHLQKNAEYTAAGAPMKRQRWRRRWACPTPASAPWCA